LLVNQAEGTYINMNCHVPNNKLHIDKQIGLSIGGCLKSNFILEKG